MALNYQVTVRSQLGIPSGCRPPRTRSIASSRRGEELGQVVSVAAGQVVELGAAGEAVGQDDRVRAGGSYGREERGLGDGD
jgi:hypothetical protein